MNAKLANHRPVRAMLIVPELGVNWVAQASPMGRLSSYIIRTIGQNSAGFEASLFWSKMRFAMKYFLAVFALILAVGITSAQLANEVPAYHKAPPAKGEKLPPIMSQQQLETYGLTQPAQREAYKAAEKDSAMLYQMPCYCYCDRHAGHKSLRSCFEGTHGANCGTCAQESLYTYQMSKKGWSAKQIRDGIIRGDFKQIDLVNPAPVK